MKKEHRQPTRAELGRITSPSLLIRKVQPPDRKPPGQKHRQKRGK
jgi:hypothetical protein